MQRRLLRDVAAFAAVLILVVFSGAASAVEVTSRMRTVSGVFEANGYRIEPVFDVDVQSDPRDRTAPQAYEIIRPDMNETLSVGRLFTSCSCIQLETRKRSFGPGERAIFVLRNIRATPAEGQMYAFFVQLTAPMETTLRFDTFVQTGVRIGNPGDNAAADPAPAAPAPEGSQPQRSPVPGLNNQLAAAFAAVGAPMTPVAPAATGGEAGEVEATGDLAVDPSEPAADDGGAAEPVVAVAEPAGEPAPLDPEEQEAALAAGFSLSAAGETASEPAAVPADTASLTEDQIFQLQQLALIQAEEQAKQLAARVQQLQAAQAGAGPDAGDGVDGTEASAAPVTAERPVQAISLITIGVRDMSASVRFYEAIGWQRAARGKYDQTAFFQLNGQVLALYPIADLLGEQNMADAKPAPGGITLALHVQEKGDVDSVYRRFIDAGGKSLRAPAEMASGAVSSYVADPDGNPWEISWVPQFRIDANGGLWLP